MVVCLRTPIEPYATYVLSRREIVVIFVVGQIVSSDTLSKNYTKIRIILQRATFYLILYEMELKILLAIVVVVA